MTDAYALFGYPVQHSWSPFIHGMFARQTAQDMAYRLVESPPERFRSDVLDFFSQRRLRHQRHPAAQAGRRRPRQRADDACAACRRGQHGRAPRRAAGRGQHRRRGPARRPDAQPQAEVDGAAHPAARRRRCGARRDRAAAVPRARGAGDRQPFGAHEPQALAQRVRRARGGCGAASSREVEHRRFDLDRQRHLGEPARRGAADPDRRRGLPDDLLRHGLRRGRHAVRHLGEAPRCGAAPSRAGACWSSRPRRPFELWRGVRPDTAPVLEVLRKRAATAARNPA